MYYDMHVHSNFSTDSNLDMESGVRQAIKLGLIGIGKIAGVSSLKSFLSWKSLLAIAIGVFVAWLGGRGVKLMSNQPDIVAGLLIGTVAGVAVLRGVPVGPLIAAGILSLLIGTQ